METPSAALSVTEVVAEFLVSQRQAAQKDDFGPAVSVVRSNDEINLINTFLCVTDPSADRLAELVGQILRSSTVERARTLVVLPQVDREIARRLERRVPEAAGRVRTLPDFLDSYLRPMEICEQLVSGTSSYAADWLREDDFIDQSALSPEGKVDAIRYLYRQWALGDTPRLCLVLAPAGHGKSKITHILAKRIARYYLDSFRDQQPSYPPVPILIPFGQLRTSTNFRGVILQSLETMGPPRVTIDAFQLLLRMGRVLFILDGYDEMLEAIPETARQNVAEFVQRAGEHSRILLTSRDAFYRTAADLIGDLSDPTLDGQEVQVVELQPFDHPQAREYLNKRLGARSGSNRLLERAQEALEDEDAFTVLRNPFFLSEFADSIEEQQWSKTDLRREGFLEFLLMRTFDRERKRQGHYFGDDVQRRFLEGIAWDMLLSGHAGYPRSDLEIFAAEALDELHMMEQDDWRSMWEKLASHHFLLADDSGRRLVTIKHQVWREFFQGNSLVLRVRATEGQAFGQAAQREIPEGVLRTAAKAMGAADLQRVRTLATGGKDRLLRNAVRLHLHSQGRNGGERIRLSVHFPDLAHRDLSAMNFVGVDFGGVDLRGANLLQTFLSGCDLRGAHLDGAQLNRTVLRECEFDQGLLTADSAALEVDGEIYYGPSIRDLFGQVDTVAAPAAAAGATDDLSVWVTDVLRDRLRRFVKQRPGEGGPIIDESVSFVAFLGGTNPKHRDFVIRRLFRALKAEGVLYETRARVSDGHPNICVADDPDVRTEVLRFVTTGEAGSIMGGVVERLMR